MKTQTAEELLKSTIENYNKTVSHVYQFEFDKSEIKLFTSMMNDHTTTQIEALRERLVNDSLQLVTVQKINSIVNEFLKEIND